MKAPLPRYPLWSKRTERVTGAEVGRPFFDALLVLLTSRGVSAYSANTYEGVGRH